MVHQTAEDAVRDSAGPHGTQGWGYLVDPDAGDHCADPEQVQEDAVSGARVDVDSGEGPGGIMRIWTVGVERRQR